MDSLFVDPMAHLLAGSEGRRQPMGAWILVPRTRRGDDVLVEGYRAGCRQLVQLGAGMDARAYRVFAPDSKSPPAAASADGSWRGGVKLDELAVFEVDQGTTFDVKEPLLEGAPLTVKSRHAIAADFALRGDWADALVRGGFDFSVPTVWLLEGLLYYLKEDAVAEVMRTIGALSAPGSRVFHDSITSSYVAAGIAPGGAPFVSGSDEYARLWKEHAGFEHTVVRDFRTIRVDRRARALALDKNGKDELTPAQCRGRELVLFVESHKVRSHGGL